MAILAEKDGRLYVRAMIDRPEFVSPFSEGPFPCLLWDHDGRFTDPERIKIAKRLIQSGCRYAVCGGQNCEAWHDAVDLVLVEMHLGEPESAQGTTFVMTTFHQGESPDEVASFFVLNTKFDAHNFKRYLVLHVGPGPAEFYVDSAVKKHVNGIYAI